MSFRILRADDDGAWREVLERFPPSMRDLHYLPEYGLIYRDTYGYEPMLAVHEHGDLTAIHAFVARHLGSLRFLEQARQTYRDIATPYGFGGPLLSSERGDSLGCLRAFDAEFRRWCIAERYASEFACLHPVLQNRDVVLASGIVQPVPVKPVVIVDLRKTEEQLWADISRGTRASIHRAEREGVQVEQAEPDAAALAAFRELYLQTMQRRGAALRWFFPESYFADCVRRLGSERSALFLARCDGELAAAYLLINDACTAYYHFGASDERWFARRPSNLLMHETIRWARRRGLTRLHLGGGVTAAEDDPLLRFKSSYGGYRSVLYTYCRIHAADVYADLCELKRQHERRTGELVADPDYFPLYRR